MSEAVFRLGRRAGSMVLFSWLVVACGPSPPEHVETASVEEVQVAEKTLEARGSLPAPGSLDRTARFLAGLEPAGALSAEDWQQHAEEMAVLWGELESRRLDEMRRWARRELTLLEPSAPLVYPFGGPDFLSASQFFPQAASYLLIGLEAPGEVWIPALQGSGSTELAGLPSGDLAADLERLRGGFRSLLDAGYFVTRRMEEDLAGAHLNGVLPVLLMFLAHGDWTVLDAVYVEIGRDGAREALPTARAPANGLRIRFRAADDETPRALYYISQDLSNDAFAGSGVAGHLESLAGFNVYMKSAQYLIHEDAFAALRDTLLAGALDVLQDDSGLPLRVFDEERWRRRFFGHYARTLPAYREYFQPALAQAYAEAGGDGVLPFALGYNTEVGGGCLIWAQRRQLGER